MKNLSVTFCLAIVTFASPVWSETIDDFVIREGQYYLKFMENVFSGQVEDRIQGTLEEGVWEDSYIEYYETGQRKRKVTYKDGKKLVFRNSNTQMVR